jgi:general secretion pathway protein H
MRYLRGFTLLELLVVMVIIGIIATMTTITIPSLLKTPQETAAKRLTQLFYLASEEAIYTAQALGIGFYFGGYRFYRLQQNQETNAFVWQEWAAPPFEAQAWPKEVAVDVFIEQRRIVLETDPEKLQRPQIFVLASGEYLPEFRLEFFSANPALRVKEPVFALYLNAYGQPELKTP